MIYFLLIVVIAIIFIYFYQFKPNKAINIKELYAEGLDMLFSGKHKAAYKNFKEIVEKDSNKIHEAADVFYHLIIYLEANNIKIEDVMTELNKRKK